MRLGYLCHLNGHPSVKWFTLARVCAVSSVALAALMASGSLPNEHSAGNKSGTGDPLGVNAGALKRQFDHVPPAGASSSSHRLGGGAPAPVCEPAWGQGHGWRVQLMPRAAQGSVAYASVAPTNPHAPSLGRGVPTKPAGPGSASVARIAIVRQLVIEPRPGWR